MSSSEELSNFLLTFFVAGVMGVPLLLGCFGVVIWRKVRHKAPARLTHKRSKINALGIVCVGIGMFGLCAAISIVKGWLIYGTFFSVVALAYVAVLIGMQREWRSKERTEQS